MWKNSRSGTASGPGVLIIIYQIERCHIPEDCCVMILYLIQRYETSSSLLLPSFPFYTGWWTRSFPKFFLFKFSRSSFLSAWLNHLALNRSICLFPLNFKFNALLSTLVPSIPFTWSTHYGRFSTNSVKNFWTATFALKYFIPCLCFPQSILNILQHLLGFRFCL